MLYATFCHGCCGGMVGNCEWKLRWPVKLQSMKYKYAGLNTLDHDSVVKL